MRKLWSPVLATALLAVGAFSGVLFSADTNEAIIVGPNVQVSAGRPTLVHHETTVCADPTDSTQLLAASMYSSNPQWLSWGSNRNHRRTIVYASHDGGKTWTPTLEVQPAADPTCAFALDHSVYYAAMTPSAKQNQDGTITVYRSTDGGRTWPTRTELAPTGMTFLDRPWIAVDATSGPFSGRVYVSLLGISHAFKSAARGLLVFQSDDRGQTFVRRAQVAFDKSGIHNGGTDAMRDGTLIGAFFETQPSHNDSDPGPATGRVVSYALAPGGGEVPEMPTSVVGPVRYGQPPVSTDHIPSLVADRTQGPFHDRLYAVWTDLRSGRAEVWFAFSNDRGVTWSAGRTINDDDPFDIAQPSRGPHAINPAIAVNRDGVVGVSWYDRRDNPERGYWPRFSASLDGGETWLPSIRVSEKPFGEVQRTLWETMYPAEVPARSAGPRVITLTLGRTSRLARTGDTSGLTADAVGAFHPVWIDDRTGVNQVWTAAVSVAGKVRRRVDVTRFTEVEIGERSRLDEETGRLVAQVRVTNTSTGRLMGPVELEWVTDSQGSRSERRWTVRNADNGRAGPRALWLLQSSGTTLAPGDSTPWRELLMQLAPAVEGGEPDSSLLVHLSLRVLAGDSGLVKRNPESPDEPER